MADIVTYCKDTSALIVELQEKFPERISLDNESDPKFIIEKSPTIRSGSETLSLVRVDADDYKLLSQLKNITILGTYDEIFADNKKKAIYDKLYPRKIQTYIDPDGKEQKNTPADKFAVFA